MIELIRPGGLWLSTLLCFLVITALAQVNPDSPAKSLITRYPPENLDSKVYSWIDVAENEPVAFRILASGSTTHLESLKISAIALEANQRFSGKEQQSEQLLIVKEGLLAVEIPNERKELGPGSVALILPGDQYHIDNHGETPAIYYLLQYRSRSPAMPARGKKAGGSLMIDWNQIEYREHSKGGRRDFFDRPTTMCEDFEMHLTNLNVNTSSHAPHTHQVEEIILMVQGDISMHIDGTETPASKGDFAFVDSMVPHAPTNIGTKQAIYFAFQWK